MHYFGFIRCLFLRARVKPQRDSNWAMTHWSRALAWISVVHLHYWERVIAIHSISSRTSHFTLVCGHWPIDIFITNTSMHFIHFRMRWNAANSECVFVYVRKNRKTSTDLQVVIEHLGHILNARHSSQMFTIRIDCNSHENRVNRIAYF